MKADQATYGDLYQSCKKKINLVWKNEDGLTDRKILLSKRTVEYPSLVTGFLNLIHPERLHVIGTSELEFINSLTKTERIGLVARLAEKELLGVVITDALDIPEDMVESLKQRAVPIFYSKNPAEEVLTAFRNTLVKIMAPRCSMHGVFMDVFGLGVLMTGQSGIGKSELGLELVTRGHGLVADDVVDFIRTGPETIEGRPPELLADLLEVRGIGLLNIKTIFGEAAVRRKMRLNLIAEMHQFDEGELMERLPETDLYSEVLGKQVKKMIIPVGGGRNLAVLVEAAVRSAILQMRGIDTIQEFFNRQRDLIESQQKG